MSFFKLRNSLPARQERLLSAEQQDWLRDRMSCGRDADCIENAMSAAFGASSAVTARKKGDPHVSIRPSPSARTRICAPLPDGDAAPLEP